MRYVTADRKAVERAGLNLFGRVSVGRDVVVNEKELMYCAGLSGDFDERVEQLGGTAYTHNQIVNLISDNKRK